ncbi:hypothetical protein [Niabella ginsengisoli]|uniref:DUF1232 domain-containing protein n=1 Tax=Niabella ginsengisoli TaxID=522298 RepID=A0ABS9SLI0_9BACT|nr:hypothetical protein [Niabella ginsengisoli]MCH5599236.1 hypothetical protein [Niabella ginsengisoli]
MSSTTSVAQEFYKIREEWARVDKLKTWNLAVWIATYQDIDIIDKFIETERLPIGIFDDIFFASTLHTKVIRLLLKKHSGKSMKAGFNQYQIHRKT